MKIELYLKSIDQEMIDSIKKPITGADTIPSGCSIYGSWPKSCCILDFFRIKDSSEFENIYDGFVLRKENVGGMFWDPRTGSVYKTDEEGYHALLDLSVGVNEKEIAQRLNVNIEKLNEFIFQLKSLNKVDAK